MRKLLACLLLLTGTGCHSLEARAPLPPSTAGRGSERAISVSVERGYEPTDPARLFPGRFSPVVDVAAVSSRTMELLVARGTAGPGRGPTLEANVIQAAVRYEGQTGI